MSSYFGKDQWSGCPLALGFIQSRRLQTVTVGSLSILLCVVGWLHRDRFEPEPLALPNYVLEVQPSHCSNDAVMENQTLQLRSGAVLDVTLRPARAVMGAVSLRTFVKHPDLPPIRRPFEGEETPSGAGTFHLRERMDSPIGNGPSLLLFELSRPTSWFSLRPTPRQVLVLSVNFADD